MVQQHFTMAYSCPANEAGEAIGANGANIGARTSACDGESGRR